VCLCVWVCVCTYTDICVCVGDSDRDFFLCCVVLRRGYLFDAWPHTVIIPIEFKFIVPESWQLVVFCTGRILPERLKFVENFPLRLHRDKHTCKWVMLHIWVSHVTHVNKSWHTCERVMSHMWMSHGYTETRQKECVHAAHCVMW